MIRTEGGGFEVRLRAEQLVATRWVFMFRHDWDSLAAFFADLASSWRGWDGEKTWASAEGDLEISVTADALGHCTFAFVVRDGPTWSWLARLERIRVDAGEDMTLLARRIEGWMHEPLDGVSASAEGRR